MSGMIVKTGEIICIASGIFESYDRAGRFVATQDFDLDAFVEKVKPPAMEPWELTDLMWNIPRFLLQQGLIAKTPCRNIYLGAMGKFEVGEEKEYSD